MGKRKREHKQAVVAGTKKPFRASPDKLRMGEHPILSASDRIMQRIRAMKEATGG